MDCDLLWNIGINGGHGSPPFYRFCAGIQKIDDARAIYKDAQGRIAVRCIEKANRGIACRRRDAGQRLHNDSTAGSGGHGAALAGIGQGNGGDLRGIVAGEDRAAFCDIGQERTGGLGEISVVHAVSGAAILRPPPFLFLLTAYAVAQISVKEKERPSRRRIIQG